MIKIISKEDCFGCHACVAGCPKQCIAMRYDEEGFLYPSVDESRCIDCGLCDKACLGKNEYKKGGEVLPDAYAAINIQDEIRSESSSGGVFSAVAEYVLAHGGVVFGAAFNEHMEVEHICVEAKEELYRLRGSKYVQSCIGRTYQEVKCFLEKGKKVLFTGTPCQVGGLKAYLGKAYDNLICQDIICHGVPSTTIWKKYVAFREEKAKSRVSRISFRYKESGWKKYSVQFVFENGTEHTRRFSKDCFMKGFLRDLYLRPSCYQCKFKGTNRLSDITLADFWGIQNCLPQMDDDKGVSLVLVHSSKGRKMLEDVKNELVLKRVNVHDALKGNPSALQSAKMNKYRTCFMKEIIKYRPDRVINKYCRLQYCENILNRVKEILK